MTTKRALVVGGTAGIGKGIALALARRNFDVIIAGRSAERGQSVVDQMNSDNNNSNNNNKHAFIPIDALDLASCKSVADKIDDTNLDVLVMTQGMATLQGYTPTPAANGLDAKLQLHYFSRVYLAQLLAPKMNSSTEKSENSTYILTVLSAGVHGKYKYAETDFELKEHYSIKNAADAAGYYTDAAFEKLSCQYEDINFCHAAPGFVSTNWGTEMPWALRTLLIRPLQALFGKSYETCGETLVQGLLSINNKKSNDSGGFYLMDQHGQCMDPPSSRVQHTSTQERDMIWEKTQQLLPDV